MRTIIRPGVGGIFGRTSSVGTLVDGAALAYSADQRPLPVLHGFGAEWAPGQPTPDRATYLAHGYYRGVETSDAVARICPSMPYQWDCNMPNWMLVSIYTAAAKDQTGGYSDRFVGLVRNGTLPPPPGFPSLAKGASLIAPPSAPPPMLRAPAESNVGLFIGLGVAALALGGAVLAKKKRAA